MTISIGRTHAEGPSRTSVLAELHWWRHLHRLAQEDHVSAKLALQSLREVTYWSRI